MGVSFSVHIFTATECVPTKLKSGTSASACEHACSLLMKLRPTRAWIVWSEESWNLTNAPPYIIQS